MPRPEGPFRCDICGHGFKYLRPIRVVIKEGFTRVIFQAQCHNEHAHEIIPHLVQISVRIENLLSHDAEGQEWKQIPEAAVVREFDYSEDMRIDDLLGMCQNCQDSCNDCPYALDGEKSKQTEEVRFMSTNPAKIEDSPEIKEMRAKTDKAAAGIINEMLKRKDALLKAALEYNALAGQFSQEAIAIDFKTGSHGPRCRISLAEPGMFLDTVADPDEEEHEAH
jgi:hypothetical protein